MSNTPVPYTFARREAGNGRFSFIEAANIPTSIGKRYILLQQQVHNIAVSNLTKESQSLKRATKTDSITRNNKRTMWGERSSEATQSPCLRWK